MSESLPTVYLARHGETEWARTGQHTGRADIPLTENGEEQARRLGRRLAGIAFDTVWSSPLQRAKRTGEIAGYSDKIEIVDDLMEWHYGDYEARTAEQIRADRPDWFLFRDGCPGGESLAEVSVRGEQLAGRLKSMSGNVLVFAHGHILRVLAACWLGLTADHARCFHLGTGALCVLSFEHEKLDEPAIRLWNDESHLAAA